MPQQTLTLRINAINKNALTGIEGTTKAVTTMVRDILKQIDLLMAGFEKVNAVRIDQGVLEGAASIERALSGVMTSTQETAAELKKLTAGATAAGNALSVAGRKASGAESYLLKSADAARAAQRELTDVGAAGDLAGEGLEATSSSAKAAVNALSGLGRKGALAATLKEIADASNLLAPALVAVGDAAEASAPKLLAFADAAAVVRKALSSLSRSATVTFDRLQTLSTAKFDPAGIIAGADAATTALAGTRRAAAGTVAAVSAARRRAAGGAAAEEGTLLGRAGRGVASAGTAGAVGITGLAALGFAADVNFQAQSQKVLGNTSITPLQQAQMQARVLELMRTGTPSEQLFDAYMHAGNFGYKGSQADAIVEYSNRFGIGTQTPVGETADTIAGLMAATTKRDASGRITGAPLPATPENIMRMAGVGHAAAISSNMTFKDFERRSSKTFGTGFGYNVQPDDLAALYASLVFHRTSPARADTQISGLLQQIAAPSPKATKRASALGLTDVFNASALANPAIGATGILGRVRDAVNNLPVNERPSALKDLFNNKQGGYGAGLLTNAAWETANQIRNNPQGTRAAWQGKVDFATPLYSAAQKTPGQAVAQVKGAGMSDAVKIGEAFQKDLVKLGPVLIKVMDGITKLVLAFTKLPKPIQEATLAFGGLVIVGKALETITGISAILPGFGEKLGLLKAAGMGAAEGEGAAAAGAGLLSAPVLLAVAAVALLAIAWKNDFGHIREVTAKVLGEVGGFFKNQFGSVLAWYHKEFPQIQQTTQAVLNAIQGFWKQNGQRIMAIIGPAWDFIKQTIVHTLHFIENTIDLVMDLINGKWGKAWGAFKGMLGDVLMEVASIIVNGGKIVGNAAMLLVDQVISKIKEIDTGIYNIGKDIVMGLIHGIEDNAAKVGSAVHNLATSAISKAKVALGIASPSKVFHGIGINIGEGLASGIRDGIPGVITASQAMAQAAASVAEQRLAIRTKYRNEEAALSAREQASGSGRDAAAHTAIANARDRELTTVTIQSAVNRVINQAITARARQAGDAAKRFAPIAERTGAAYDALQEAGPGQLARALARNQESLDQVTAAVKGISGGAGPFGAILRAYGQITQSHAQELFTANKQAALDAHAKQTGEAADKATLIDVEFGYKSAADAAAYFQGRVDALTAAGKHGTDEWAEAMRTLKQFNAQVADTQLGQLKDRFDNLTEGFQSGDFFLSTYTNGLKDILAQIDAFETAHPDSFKALEGFRAEVAGAAGRTDQRSVADQLATIKNGVTTGGDKEGAITALQALLPLAADKSPLQAQIKTEIAHLSKSIKTEADTFWKAFMEPLDSAIRETFDNLFKKGGKRKSGKEIFSSFLEGEGNALLKVGEDRISGSIQGALLGANGKGNPLSFLGSLFGGGKGHGGTQAGYTGTGTGLLADKDGKAYEKVPAAFKIAKGSMLQGAMAVFQAANALASAFAVGGRKRKVGGLLGGIIGGVVGSLVPGGWLLGAQLGMGVGGMLGFAGGGTPPVGVPSIVGERGPEMFLPRVPGTIIPNHAIKAMTGGGGITAGGFTVNHNTYHYGDVNGVADYEDRQRQDARNLERTYRSFVPSS